VEAWEDRTEHFSVRRVWVHVATLQGRKSLSLCWAGVLRIRWIDPITQVSELPDHFGGAPLFRLLGDHWAPFFVAHSLMQDQPDQLALSMGNGPDGLLVPVTRYRAAIDKDTSFRPYGGIGRLLENAPHVRLPLGDGWL
jgi:hypothetical protein